MRGKFSQRLGLWRWRDQTGGCLGNPQHHGVAVGDEDIAHTVGARASRDQRKTTPEEWMTGVCDFHFSQVVYQWVVDRGIKVCARSTTWTGALCGSVSSRESVREEYADGLASGGTRACWRRER